MKVLAQYVFNGVVLGLIYALVASGYSLIFGVLRLVNFSHGSLYALGAMISLFFIGINLNPWISMLISLILTGLVGIIVNKVAVEPLRNKKSAAVTSCITTVGLSYIIQNLLVAFFGSERRPFPEFYNVSNWSITIVGYSIKFSRIFLFVTVSILLLTLSYIVEKTRIGLGIRAVQQNERAARLVGVNVNRTITITFFLAGISASIAGTLVSGYYTVAYPMMGASMGSKTLAAALLGGLGSMRGSFLGGIIVGVLESIVAGTLGIVYRDAVSFIVLILILIIRPVGLLGKKTINKV